MVKILADVGDLHVGSTLGLLPINGAEGEDGQTIMPSPFQVWEWEAWLSFWAKVAALKAEYEAGVVGTLGGDLIDGDRPNGVQRWTLSRDCQQEAAVKVLAPALEVVDTWFVTTGTPYHSGAGGQADRAIAKAIRARKYNGQSVAERLLLLMAGVLIEVSHPSRISTLPWTRGGPAIRLAAQVLAEYGEMGERVPDLVLAHHGHRVHDSGDNFRRPRVVICPGWQPITEFAHHHNIRGACPVGGVIAVMEDGRLIDVLIQRYWPPQEKAVRA